MRAKRQGPCRAPSTDMSEGPDTAQGCTLGWCGPSKACLHDTKQQMRPRQICKGPSPDRQVEPRQRQGGPIHVV